MHIYDNGGKTFDRYTLIDLEGNVFAFSANPFHPQGFNQFCGNHPCDSKALGREATLLELPEDVQRAIIYRLTSE